MAASKILFLLTLLIISCHAFPEYRATGEKLVKIKQREKTKNILIMTKTAVSSDDNNSSPKESAEEPGRNQPESSPEATNDDAKSNAEKGPIGTLPHVGGHGHGVSVDGSCVNPNPEPLQIYSKFAKTLVTHRMFVLASSRYYAEQASLSLTGESFHDNKASKACLRVMWENDRRRLQGYGHSSILSCVTAGQVTDFTCFRDINKDATLRITYVWSDGRSNVLAIMCGKGFGSWAILSNERIIEPHTKEAILQVVESYGFDPEDIVDYPYTEDDCPSSVQNTYKEGNCVESDDDLETIPASKTHAALKILESGVYTPMSSYANAFATGMFIQGRPVKTVEQLDNICVKDIWSPSGEVERQGFGNKDAFLECDISDFTRISCLPNEEKADPDSSGIIYNRHIHPIWTDGKKYVLTYNCLSTRFRTWSLLSTSKEPVDHDTKRFILSKVADYGFDTSKGYEADYEHCNN